MLYQTSGKQHFHQFQSSIYLEEKVFPLKDRKQHFLSKFYSKIGIHG